MEVDKEHNQMTEEQARKVGALIATGRAKKELSLRDLAQLTGIPPTTITRIEQGDYSQPAPDNLARLIEALEIDPARIDRVSRNYLADSLPSVGTYFRSKEKASPEEVAEIEAAVKAIREKHARRRRQ
jgi:transcriptional regulator with XRE-family HTH domain